LNLPMLRKVLTILLLAAAVAASASQAEERFQAGIAALKRDDLAGAQALFEEAVRLDPRHVGSWILLAQTYAKRQNQPSAVEAARKAETLAADDPDVLLALANLYSGLIRDPARAARLGMRYAELRPQDRTAWRRTASFCLSSGQFDCSVDAARKGLQNDNSAALHGILGQAYLAREEWSQAAAELDQAVKLDPYDEDLHFHLAQVYLLQQDFPATIRVLENARKYFDKSPQIELTLGVAHYGQRDFARAVDQFLRTIRLAPDIPQPYLFLGRVLEHAGDRMADVSASFAAYQARNPRQPLGYVLHAKAIIIQTSGAGDPAQAQAALDLLQQSLALREDDAEAHYLAGLVLERQGEFARAATHLERSVALNANDPAPHYQLARVYSRLGRKQDSERERALHEKLSNEVNASDPLGMPSAIPRAPGPAK
jgi:tetratricopeptide (TPR) repeat protein